MRVSRPQILNILGDTGDFIAEIHALSNRLTTDWALFPEALPSEALDIMAEIEFRFEFDDFTSSSGWYNDDFELTVP